MVKPEQLVEQFLMGSKQSKSGLRRLQLLSKISDLGSLSEAAQACGMSYKGAWQAVDAMNTLAGERLIFSQKGGAGGGGTTLTDAGEALLSSYLLFIESMHHWIRELESLSPELMSQTELMRKVSMKTSARNMFHGTVTSILEGEVDCEVVVSIGSHTNVVAQITPSSVARLGLSKGSDVYALIKASWVILAEDTSGAFKVSARNQFCGEVRQLEQGRVNSDVTLELADGQQISAIVTNESVKNLGLQMGAKACAFVKSSQVLLAVSD